MRNNIPSRVHMNFPEERPSYGATHGNCDLTGSNSGQLRKGSPACHWKDETSLFHLPSDFPLSCPILLRGAKQPPHTLYPFSPDQYVFTLSTSVSPHSSNKLTTKESVFLRASLSRPRTTIPVKIYEPVDCHPLHINSCACLTPSHT